MIGKLVKTDHSWKIETKTNAIEVHKSCLLQLTEDMNGKVTEYAVIKDFTSNNQGTEYALPIIE